MCFLLAMPTYLSESHTMCYPPYLIKPVIQHPMFLPAKFSPFVLITSFASLYHAFILMLGCLTAQGFTLSFRRLTQGFIFNLPGLSTVEKKEEKKEV